MAIASAAHNKNSSETLIPISVKEQKRYERDEVVKMFASGTGRRSDDEKRAVECMKKLKEYNILRAVRPQSGSRKDFSELNDTDFVMCDPEDVASKNQYVFTFVGVIVISGRVLRCCPKYLSGEGTNAELSEIVKVIEKYSDRHEDINMFTSADAKNSFNLLAVLLYLLGDYYEFGVYSNTEQILESNGTGEIHWDRTINDTFTLIQDGRPYYPDLRTKRNKNDEHDYFRRLHECILTLASGELGSCGLLDVFGIPEVDLSEEELESFGEREAILYNIGKEMTRQFNSRKQNVLKAMYSYVERGKSLSDTDGFSLYGTNAFNLVWEDVCSEIFDNCKNKMIYELGLPGHSSGKFNRRDKLIDCIGKPYWSEADAEASETLEPDIIHVKDGKFVILDAKYYVPQLDKGRQPYYVPGIESVTKQYLYELAYRKFTDEYGLAVSNCFLFPTEGDSVIEKGYVSLPILSDLGLETIKVRFLPARECYRMYLRKKKMDIKRLMLDK